MRSRDPRRGHTRAGTRCARPAPTDRKLLTLLLRWVRGRDERTALQLPLYTMAAERLLLADRQAAPWCAGYWHVREKGFQPKQSLAMGRLHDDRLEPDPEWEDLRQLVSEIAGALVEGIRNARFPVHSADNECGRFCPFRTICRINQVRSLEKRWQPLPDPS